MFNEEGAKDDESHLNIQKYESIMKLLLSAGYFRARAEGLSKFDKVIGGLCWCIMASGKHVDANILFDENMPLGKKIKLSETVCRVLIKMKCKSLLIAHQIQGLDFKAIYPVIKWLVQQVYDFRSEQGEDIREYTHHNFGKYHSAALGSDVLEHERAYMHDLDEQYKRERVLRRPVEMWEKETSEKQLLQTCLLEFGERVSMSAARLLGDDKKSEDKKTKSKEKGGGMSDAIASAAKRRENRVKQSDGKRSKKKGADAFDKRTQKKFADLQKAERKREEREARLQAENEERLLKVLGGTSTDAENAVRGKNVGRLVTSQAAAIKAASDEYSADAEATRQLIEKREPQTRKGKAAAFKRRKAALERQMAMKEKMAAMMAKRVQMISARADGIEARVRKSEAHNKKVEAATAKLAELEGKSEFKSDLAKLRNLVLLNESLKMQEKEFKESCRTQKKEWETKIEAVRSGEGSAEETKRLLEIEEMYAEVSSKYNRGRQLLARKAREVARLLRQIDDVPLRSELIQYERRFTELDDLLAAKFDEYSKYFGTYNNLNEQRMLYDKEARLIQQINDIFEAAMKSANQKESFLTQCANIAEVVKKSIAKKAAVLQRKETQMDATSEELQQLVDKQRKYLKLVSKFQAACDLNEKLSANANGGGAS